jgi:Domain of unknown function (DUF5134)
MVTALAARWLLTAVFAAAGLGAARPRRRMGTAPVADGVSVAFCAVMCAALIVMTWRSEPAAAAWSQAAVFGCAALWFGLPGLAGGGRLPRLPAVLHALMAGAMIWMLAVMPGAADMPPGRGHGAMPAMSGAATPAPVLVISILLAISCTAASIPWLARAIGPGPRLKDPAAAGQAAMSAGMAAMLIVML